MSQSSSNESAHNGSRETSPEAQDTREEVPFKTLGNPPTINRYLLRYHTQFVQWWLSQRWVAARVREDGPDLLIDYERQLNWKGTARRSEIWKKFRQGALMDTIAKVEDRGKPVVVCRNCGAIIEHPSNTKIANGTSTMTQHVKSKKCVRTQGHNGQRQRTLHERSAVPQMGALEKDEFYDLLLSTIISQNWSFRSVENPEWRRLALRQNPHFQLPAASTLARRLTDRVKAFEETALADVVPGSKVAVSLDCWSSTTRLGFMAIVVYFIDKDWKYREVLIGFEHLKEIHTGVELAKIINDVFDKHKLQGRVTSITTDNASNNGTMITEINDMLQEALEAGRLLGGQVQHIPCLAHVLQLSLKDMLGSIRIKPKNEVFQKNFVEDEELEELEKIAIDSKRGIPYVLAKLRKLVIFTGSSSQRRWSFELSQAPFIADPLDTDLTRILQLPLDVKTRFDSTCHMLIRARRLQGAINDFTKNHIKANVFSLSQTEWRLIEYLIDLTRPIAFMTTAVGKSSGVTIQYGFKVFDYMFERFWEARRRLNEKKAKYEFVDPLITAVEKAEKKLEKYYRKLYTDLGSVYAISAILDPGNKLRGFNPNYTWLATDRLESNWRETYREQIDNLFQQKYFKPPTIADRHQILHQTTTDRFAIALNIRRVGEPWQRESSASTQEPDTAELDHYLDTRVHDGDILEFWKAAEIGKYPQLAKMARDFLCCPLAGLGVERIFNFSREICNFRRGKLSPETIRALILLYFQMVSTHRLDDARAQFDNVLETSDWDEDDFLDAIQQVTDEISAAESSTNELCQPQYISDEEELTAGTRTEWTRDLLRKARREDEAKRRNMRRENELLAAAQGREQTLGRPAEVRAQNEAIAAEQNCLRYANRPATNWEVPSDEEINQGLVDNDEDGFLDVDEFADVDEEDRDNEDLNNTRHPPTSSQLLDAPPTTPVTGTRHQSSRPAAGTVQVARSQVAGTIQVARTSPEQPAPEVIVTLLKPRGRRQTTTTHNNNDGDTDMGGLNEMSLPAHLPGARPMLIPQVSGVRRSASSSGPGNSAGRSVFSSGQGSGTRRSASSSNLVPKALSKASKASKPTGVQKQYRSKNASASSLSKAPRNPIADLHRSGQGFS